MNYIIIHERRLSLLVSLLNVDFVFVDSIQRQLAERDVQWVCPRRNSTNEQETTLSFFCNNSILIEVAKCL